MDRQNFCVLPFTTMYVEDNRVRLCCESEEEREKHITPTNTITDIWYSDFYKDIRQQMLDGVSLPNACRICKMYEDVGEESKRYWDNHQYNKFIGDVNDFQTTEPPLPINFDIRPSNKCNLECVMCDGIQSSAISERVSAYNKSNFIINKGYGLWKKHKAIIDYVKEHSNKIRILKLDGGEPFLLPEVLEIIDHLVETGDAKHIRLSFITNGTVVRGRWFRDKLVHFEDVKIVVSLDAVGDVLNYVRYPAKWSVVDKNIRMFKDICEAHKNIRLNLDPVAHLLNTMHLHEVFEYAKQVGVRINLTPVYQVNGEEYLHTKLLTDELREQAYNKLKPLVDQVEFGAGQGFIEDLRNQEYDPDAKQIRFLNDSIAYWDSHRATKFEQQYPYLKYLLTNK